MPQWEYRSFVVQIERVEAKDDHGRTQKYDDWVVHLPSAGRVGFDTVLAVEGGRGWELVSLLPSRWTATDGSAEYSAHSFRAVFKRPVQQALDGPQSGG